MTKQVSGAPISINSRPLTFMKDTVLEYPEMYMNIFIQGTSYEEAQFAEMFVRSYCTKASDPLKADLVVFTGGADVDPLLYGETPYHTTRSDPSRDKHDILLYDLCLEHGIPMLGICRGAQFLHVMNGGKLYQDVDNHYGDHDIWDLKGKKLLRNISSVHHQLVKENKEGGMEIIAHSSGRSKVRWLNPSDKETNSNLDIEAFFYRDTCSIGIQGHPEYRGYSQFQHWSLKLIQELVTENPDIELRKALYRLKSAPGDKDVLPLPASIIH